MRSRFAIPVALLGGGALLLALTRKSSAAPSAPSKPAVPPPTPPGTKPATPSVPVIPPSTPIAAGAYAVVTTNDPPPMGDLIIREAPSATAPQVINTLTGGRDGGAEKGGLVKILNWNASPDGIFAQVQWQGGSRRGPATGYARKAYLKPSSSVPATPAIPTSPAPAGTSYSTAVVTTNDPPPSGDLIVRSSPSATAKQIGGAEKNGTVQVVNWNADGPTGIFAEIIWSGGSRWPAVRGFARKAYLKMTPTTSGLSVVTGKRVVEGHGRPAAVACMGGCRIRTKASPSGETLKVLPPGEVVRIHKLVPGVKGDRTAPGPGGWALVSHGEHKGWMPSEWLKV